MSDSRLKSEKILYFIFLAVLAVYPLRNIWLGLEMMDGGYSAGNYLFMDRINPMWLFSTYLANVTGKFFTGLPGGQTLIGLRFYGALVVSAMALLAYLFFTKTVRMRSFPVLIGELLALSLCWCPTTVLYHYMTYFFFNAGIIVLYLGLVKERRPLLFLAGVLLGMNVLVRFPNLTNAALICSLWYYGFLQRKRVKDVLQETGVCLFGYLAGIGIVLASIAAKYGIHEYITGIGRLLEMPSEASDYSAVSMVLTVLLDYKFSAKWLVHMVLLAAAGCLVSAVLYGAADRFCPADKGAEIHEKSFARYVEFIGKILFSGCILALFRWWHAIGVFNVKYYTYESMFQWVAVFLILTIFTGIYVLFSKKCTRNEKLLASMVLILIGVTPLGSNNHLYPNINNMFLVFPFSILFFRRFLKNVRENREIRIGKAGHRVSLFPVGAMFGAFLAATAMQCLLFGAVFTFKDGMYGEKRDTRIENNAVLKGIVTNAPLAEAVEGLTQYVETEGLSDKSVILYGWIPAVSYLLDMPVAISTSWPDLASYNYAVMAEDMERLRESGERPIIILGTGPEQWIRGEALTQEEIERYMLNGKWEMLYGYMVEQGYEKVYGNDMFTVYQ